MFYHIDGVCVEFIWLFISLGALYPPWLPVEIKQKWKTFRSKVHLYLESATNLRIISDLLTGAEIYAPWNVCHETAHVHVLYVSLRLYEITYRGESEFLYKSGDSNSVLSPRFSSSRMLFRVDWCVRVATTVSEECNISPASVTV
jgi:hypothetical protein